MLNKALETIIGLYAPHSCLACGVDGAIVCQACMRAQSVAEVRCYRCHRTSQPGSPLPSRLTCTDCLPYGLDAASAAKVYDATAKALVWRLKFERGRSAAASMAAPMAALCRHRPDTTIVVPVPTAPARVRTRGYDQAVLLAKAIAKRNGFRYTPLLQRVSRVRQVGANLTQRRQQMQGAFVPRARPVRQLTQKITQARGLHIILVDDVITTGSTFESAAQTLRKSGLRIRSIEAVAFAQAQLADHNEVHASER